MTEINKKESSDNNLFELLWFRLFPYWLLFIILSVIFLGIAYFIAKREKPTYTVAASIAINDEETALSNNQPIRALNAFAVRQTVDNEVLVLKSRSLMKNVVKNLHLYAPIGEQGRFSEATVYSSAPIIIEALNPDSIKKFSKVFFSYSQKSNHIEIKGIKYPLDQWIHFPYATLRFKLNPRNIISDGDNYYFSLLDPTSVASSLLGGLTVITVSKLSTVINLTFQGENPQKAADILNELLREYMRNTVENENQLASGTLAFVEKRLTEVEAELDSIEKKIEQFRTGKGVINLDQQGRIYLEGIAANDQRITDLNTQLAVLNQVDLYLNAEGRQTGIVPTSLGISDPVLSELLQRLNILEIQLAGLKTTTGENNPMVVSIENEIQKIRPNIRNIVSNQRDRLLASRNNLNSTSNRYNKSVQNIPAQERELLEISRQQDVKRDLYSFLLQRREEAALGNSSNLPESQIIDWAEPSTAAVNSKKMFFLLGGLVAAFALAFFYIIIKEVLNNKVLFRSSIESLTTVPVVAEVLNLNKSSPLLLQKESHKFFLEQFRKLLVAIGLYEGEAHQQKILVTSSVANEGKSFIGSHFATALALSGKRVVLLDFNFYNPETSIAFFLERADGIKDYLQGSRDLSDLIKKTEIESLDIIPAGSETNNSVELLMKSKLPELMRSLEDQYDHIIIDSPPIELVTDAFILSRYCDLTLFIIRYGVTPQTLIRRMDENSRIEKIDNMKIIFNGIKGRGFLIKYFGFGFGYGKENFFSKKAYSKHG